MGTCLCALVRGEPRLSFLFRILPLDVISNRIQTDVRATLNDDVNGRLSLAAHLSSFGDE